MPHERLYSVYDKEMLAVMDALAKVRKYLLGIRFKVKTNHTSLHLFLEKKSLEEMKKKWVSKLHAYGFEIEYVKGKHNVVENAPGLHD